jgi:transcriptional regulator with XRE-family HTH domain
MIVIDDRELTALGSRLKDERIRRNESQALFAARIGVSIPTLYKMESGDPTVLIGHWAAVLALLGRSADLAAVLAEPEDLFARYEAQIAPKRQRATGAKGGKRGR